MRMSRWDRHEMIFDLLNSNAELSVSNIATRLRTSEVTIRKDLNALSRDGLVERGHGIVRLAPNMGRRYSLQKEMSVNMQLKEQIAVAAVDLVQEGEAVFLGPGSTCGTIMKKLVQKNNIVIITNAVNFEPLLESRSNSRIIFLGGEYSFLQGAVMGIISLDTLDSLNITKFFLGANAVSAEDGLTSENLNDTGFIKMMIERSKEVIAVVDHTKFGKSAAIRLVPINKVDKIITDRGLDEHQRELIRRQGVELMLV
ncbi:MAG: DeoR/GlpR family DNA-binding transcription regulator [Treponema sp.]|jgi:DeoR/GlpR family transcriptional regulator of sugar metabolism|nr:DeoR/GlpR family DNA-binding transcription regulator [Treponema sp.]